MALETKEDALEALEQSRAEYLIQARMVAHRIAKLKKVITINDVREVCPPPSEVDPRVMGAVFNTSDWEPVGFHLSARAHGRIVRKWRLT